MRLRLAGVLLDDKKFAEALKLLEQVKEEGFEAMVADLRGDVFAAEGRRDEARAAYQIAVDKADTRSPMKAISQSKLDASGGAIEKPADKKMDGKKTEDKDAGAKK